MEQVTDLKDLKNIVTEDSDNPTGTSAGGSTAAPSGDAPIVRAVKLDKYNRAYSTGKRKESIARVWIKAGKGNIIINGKDVSKYLPRETLRIMVNTPFVAVDKKGSFDVMATVCGGGLSGQAGAIRHGIAKALVNFDPLLRVELKKAGMMTRDARRVERKKYGLHKARKSTQFSKR